MPGKEQAPWEGLCPGEAAMPAPLALPRGQQLYSGRGMWGATAGAGGQGTGLPPGSSGECRGHTGTPQLQDRQQGQAGRNAGPGKKERSGSAPGLLVVWRQGEGQEDSPLALQGQGRVNPLPNEGARLSNQRLGALEAAGAMPEGSPGLLLPAGRGAAIPQPLRRTCKTDARHSWQWGQVDRLGSQLSPPWREPTERDRATSRHVVLGPLMLPRPPAFSKGSAGQLLDCCSLQCPRTDKVASPPRQDQGPHSTQAPGDIFQGGFKSSKGFC